jgi:hypothetical protein
MLILLLLSCVSCQEYNVFGLDQNFFQVGNIITCSNTTTCYNSFKLIIKNAKYGCFNTSNTKCNIDDTIKDSKLYASFCVVYESDGDYYSIVDNTIFEGNYTNTIITQCNNLQKNKINAFCLIPE